MTIGIFLRCPVSVAERIRSAIRRENTERATAKLDPFALYKGEPCLPPYFARAGQREAELVESALADRIQPWAQAPLGSPAREATLNVNFDVTPTLAKRCEAAIRALNRALRAEKSEPICVRSGQVSLPQFFLRAGLLELERDEARSRLSLVEPFAIAQTTPGRSIKLRAALTPGQSRSDAVRDLLRRAPATMDDLVAAGFSRYEARNTISSLVTKGDVERRGKALYALTASGRVRAAQEGT